MFVDHQTVLVLVAGLLAVTGAWTRWGSGRLVRRWRSRPEDAAADAARRIALTVPAAAVCLTAAVQADQGLVDHWGQLQPGALLIGFVVMALPSSWPLRAFPDPLLPAWAREIRSRPSQR